jgi:branched-chain amino acid transport system substrate-binding protein
LNGNASQGRTTHVSEEAHIGNLTPHVAPGRRLNERLSAPQLLAQTPEPLKIGFLTVLTGPLAAGGQQQEEGAGLFLNERDGMIAGRKVELITQDTGGNPALAKTKTQELVERYNALVMIGPLATNEAIAMDSYIRDTNVPLITITSAATVPPRKPLGVARLRHGASGDLSTWRLRGQHPRLQESRHHRRNFHLRPQGAGGFHLAFEAAGGKIVQKLWPPLKSRCSATRRAPMRAFSG